MSCARVVSAAARCAAEKSNLLGKERRMRMVDETTVMDRAFQGIHRVSGRVGQKWTGHHWDKRLIQPGFGLELSMSVRGRARTILLKALSIQGRMWPIIWSDQQHPRAISRCSGVWSLADLRL